MNNFLEGLNPEQRKICEIEKGPILVLAGAGSGKTRTLTYRITNLISNMNVSPKNILAVTFTNKSAEEMKERIAKLLGDKFEKPAMGTFHSIGVRILRSDISTIGRKNNFTIFDSSDCISAIKRISNNKSISSKEFPPRDILNNISKAKNNFINSSNFVCKNRFDEIVKTIFSEYEKTLKKENALDFDDLICLPVKIFEENKTILEKYQERWKYILVDEYQDTNHAQYKFIKLLANKYKNICVVGDDYQSIYSWRGADFNNILNFEKDYKDAKTFKLEQNYRSSKAILDIANAIIKNNTKQKEKKLWTKIEDENEQVVWKTVSRGDDEGVFIAKTLRKMKNDDDSVLSKTAILYRTNAQSRAIEDKLINYKINYKIIGGVNFYDRKEIKDILAYLKLIFNKDIDTSLVRIINVPSRGIGNATISILQKIAVSHNWSLFNSIEYITKNNKDDIVADIQKHKIKMQIIARLKKFLKMFEYFQQESKKKTVKELLDLILKETNYEESIRKKEIITKADERMKNINELYTIADRYSELKGKVGLEKFLEDIAIVTNTDTEKDNKKNNDALSLMTLHSSKGLEFENIFIIGCENNMFPLVKLSDDNKNEYEEERRLMYVGITRAKKRLFLLNSIQRILYGEFKCNSESAFLNEIPEELIDRQDNQTIKKMRKTYIKIGRKNRYGLNQEERKEIIADFKDGEKVVHNSFGNGTVVSVQGEIITVCFDSFGIKKLSSVIAPLKKI